MPSNEFVLLRLYDETPALTEFMVLVMVGFLVWTLFFKFTPKYVRLAPTIFTTLGILGTFVGISVALFKFDPNDLQHSLPAFLNGMKTAFYVSLFGVGSSLIIKLRYAAFGIPDRFLSKDPDPGTELVRHQITLHRLLSGGESSDERLPLSVQLAALRRETREGLGSIAKTLESYLSKTAENNSRALVDALKKVVEGFQSKLDESTQSSMKDLAQAVKEIVVWQENYRDAMPKITEELVKMAASMQTIGESQKAYAAQSEIFKMFFEKQGEVLKKMDSERTRVETSLNAFMKLLESMGRSLPELDKSLREFFTKTGETVRSETEKILAQMEKASETLTQNIDKNRSDFERALQRELTLSITGLGQQLGALSEKFVADYTPLTERLQSVVRMAEQVQGGR